ncbi:MAG TPA: hypothetical protein VGL45_14785 [Bradyrhizobium sp.]|jgi:hypothetical protein
MSVKQRRSRRIAVMLARHAARTLPLARSSWAEAMWRELAYIKDDRAALHWAIGCVMASYKMQIVGWLRFCGRVLSRPILAGGMLLSIALALAHASDLGNKPDCAQAATVEINVEPSPASNPLCADARQSHRSTAKDRPAQ